MIHRLALPFLLLLATATAQAAEPETLYSDITAESCKTQSIEEETGGSVQRCTGVAGHDLLILDDDARMSVTVVTPDGEEHPLDYWGVVTSAFSSLGDKAEWRIARTDGKPVPVALIVRVNTVEPDTEKPRSLLAVAKITPGAICVTDVIPPGAGANEEARRAADGAAGKPCREEPVN